MIDLLNSKNIQVLSAQAAMAFTLAPKSAKVNKVPFCLGKILSLGGRLHRLGVDKRSDTFLYKGTFRPVQNKQFASLFFQ